MHVENTAQANGGQPWDAIVIGSGLGGLTTAAYLTTNGLRTLVLEQYDTVGGCSHVFRRKQQFEFDVGLHYIGDCAPGGSIPTVLRGVGLDGKIEFLELDPDGFSTLVFPDLTFRVPRGWDRYLERLIAAFPAEERGLVRCVGVLERIGRELDRNAAPVGVRSQLSFALRSRTSVRWGMRPLARLYDACGLSDRDRAVISSESFDYASPPSRAPVAMHAAIMHHYLKSGAYYPKGGGQMLAAHLLDVIQTHGGAVRTQARVDQILVEAGKARGVRLTDGETFSSQVVISNADIKRTYLDLVGREHLSPRTVARVERYRMALPLFCVYLGLDIDLSDRLPNTQYWSFPDYDIEGIYRSAYDGEQPPEPAVYITSGSLKDPSAAQIAPPGHTSLELMTIVPPDHRFWNVADGPAAGEKYSRNPDYRAVKDQLTEALIERAARLIPGLDEHIVWKEAATPITQERFTLSSGGACYGLELATDQFGPRRPGPRTEIDGLYLTGASTVWCHGITGVMTGGVGTAGAVLGRDLHAEIRAGRVFGDPARLTAGGPGWDPLLFSRRLADKSRRRERERAPAIA